MKKFIYILVIVSLLIVTLSTTAFAKSKKVTTEIGHDVTVETTIPSGFNKIVMITFKNSAGEFGTLTLSPSQTKIENLTYKLGKQKIHIQGIELGVPHYERTVSSIVLNCWLTDWSGRHKQRFRGLVASWATGQ